MHLTAAHNPPLKHTIELVRRRHNFFLDSSVGENMVYVLFSRGFSNLSFTAYYVFLQRKVEVLLLLKLTKGFEQTKTKYLIVSHTILKTRME